MSDSDLATLDDAAVYSQVALPRRPQLAAALQTAYMLSEQTALSAARSAALQFANGDSVLRWTEGQGTYSQSLTKGHFSAADAWEALVANELVPLSWVASDERRFVTLPLHRALLDRAMDPLLSAHPHTVRGCVSVAASIDSLIAAEQLLLTVHDALAPWGAVALRPPLVWQIDDAQTVSRRYTTTTASLSPALAKALDQYGSKETDSIRALRTEAPAWRSRYTIAAIACLHAARQFAESIDRAAHARRERDSVGATSPTRSPFEPLLKLYLTGVLPISVEAQGRLALIEV